MVEGGLEVRPGACAPLGYGGISTGVVVLLAVGVASAPSPLLLVPVPALGVRLVNPTTPSQPHVPPSPTPSQPRPPRSTSRAPLAKFSTNPALAAVNHLGSLDRRHSSTAFFSSLPLLESGRCAGHVKAPKVGLSDSSAPLTVLRCQATCWDLSLDCTPKAMQHAKKLIG